MTIMSEPRPPRPAASQPRPGRGRPTASTPSPSLGDGVADGVSGRGQKENPVPDAVEGCGTASGKQRETVGSSPVVEGGAPGAPGSAPGALVPDVVDDQGAAADVKPTVIEPIDWDARLRAAVDASTAKRQAREQERAEFKARRDAGLRERHAEKLARGGALPPCCAEAPYPPCPQHTQARRVTGSQGPRAKLPPSAVIGESGGTVRRPRGGAA